MRRKTNKPRPVPMMAPPLLMETGTTRWLITFPLFLPNRTRGK